MSRTPKEPIIFPYQVRILEKNHFTRKDSDFVEFGKVVILDEFTIHQDIEIYDNENPDLLAYRGVVTLLREGDTRRVCEWDSERRYKLADVIMQCERISTMLQATIKYCLTSKRN